MLGGSWVDVWLAVLVGLWVGVRLGWWVAGTLCGCDGRAGCWLGAWVGGLVLCWGGAARSARGAKAVGAV